MTDSLYRPTPLAFERFPAPEQTALEPIRINR